jgi:FKBP-type peptidyl-prolyl cis-trans isomerase 2
MPAGGVIADGKQVSLEFTLSLEDKTQVQSNVGKEPLVYTHGAHQIVPGLEKNLVGLKVGETKHVEVTPEEGYGPVDPKRTQEVEVDKIPEGARKVGSKLTGRAPNGQMMFAEVKEIKDKMVILDMNHPLAGKKLIFDVKVLKIEDAPKIEAQPVAPAATAAPAPAAKPEKK